MQIADSFTTFTAASLTVIPSIAHTLYRLSLLVCFCCACPTLLFVLSRLVWFMHGTVRNIIVTPLYVFHFFILTSIYMLKKAFNPTLMKTKCFFLHICVAAWGHLGQIGPPYDSFQYMTCDSGSKCASQLPDRQENPAKSDSPEHSDTSYNQEYLWELCSLRN